MTRVEGLKILLNTKGVNASRKSIPPFQDVPSDSWYAPYVQYIVDHRLLEISGPVFDTNAGLKRKDVAQILYTMILADQAARLTSISSGYGDNLDLDLAHDRCAGSVDASTGFYEAEEGWLLALGPIYWRSNSPSPALLSLRIRRPVRTSEEKHDDERIFSSGFRNSRSWSHATPCLL